MNTLVIHPQDQTTDFLSVIYKDTNWNVINTNPSKKYLKEQIKLHDRIIMLGHGTENGLIGFNRLVIDSSLVYLLKDKLNICIWCNANVFVEKYKLKGFYTGMIISEYDEAVMYNIKTNYQFINDSNMDFANAIKLSIQENNVNDMLKQTKLLYEGNTSVVNFNRNNLFCKL